MEKKKIGFIKEFQTFIARGNIVDMAVGIIVGSAFTAIVTSLVNDVLMPLISLLKTGGFTDMYVGIISEGVAPEGGLVLKNGAVIEAGQTVYRTYLYYGNFIQSIINFLLIALSVFFLVKVINSIRANADKAKEAMAKEFHKNKENEKENLEEITK